MHQLPLRQKQTQTWCQHDAAARPRLEELGLSVPFHFQSHLHLGRKGIKSIKGLTNSVRSIQHSSKANNFQGLLLLFVLSALLLYAHHLTLLLFFPAHLTIGKSRLAIIGPYCNLIKKEFIFRVQVIARNKI